MKKAFINSLTFVLIFIFIVSSVAVCAYAQDMPRTVGTGDRVYFYNISGDGVSSADFIIVESDGHFGLIDAGHGYSDTVTDEQGRTYSALSQDNLSSQTEFKNGRDAAEYMINSMGITHLDFVIGTHSHSDHIGGIPDIAAFEGFDDGGNPVRLVDESTVYFYKAYRHINSKQDDITQTRSEPDTETMVIEEEPVNNSSWHNQAFCYQALKSMTERGAKPAELSRSLVVNDSEQEIIDYSPVIESASSAGVLNKIRYFEGDTNDWLDDFVVFGFGNLTIRLYNLFSHDTSIDENVNSIVTVITDGNSKFVSLSDINVENRTEQRLAKVIYEDVGTADMIKVSHHGAKTGSNSKEMFDWLKPEIAVVTRDRYYSYGNNARGSFSAAMVYARKNYNTVFYEAGATDFALVAEFAQTGFEFFNLEGTLDEISFTSADKCISSIIPYNGWSSWSVEWGEKTVEELYYIYYGEFIPHWYQDESGRYFYINADSSYQIGWQTIGKYTYYLSPEETDYYLYGEMYTGWNVIDEELYFFDEKGRVYTGWALLDDGSWYYFDEYGAAAVGWKQIANTVYCFDRTGEMFIGLNYVDDGYYFFGENGALKTGWIQDNGKWYYSEDDGKLCTGWNNISSKWYYFDENAASVSGLQTIKGKTYYFDADGAMQTCWQRIDGSWCYFGNDGVMVLGWQKIDGDWYYFNSSGAMRTGWQQIKEKWYYFDKDGTMKTAWQKIGGNWYRFDNSGVMLTGWQKISKKWYYFDADGIMLTGWQKINNKWYYFNKSGVMLTGKQTVDGKKYQFASTGEWLK